MRTLFLTAILVVLCSGLEAQRRTDRCTGTPVDPLVVVGPVYRDCDVDRPARLRGNPPRLNWTPSGSDLVDGRCFRAEFQFIVDTLGVPDLSTLQAVSSNNGDYAEAVRASLSVLRYEPARLDGRPVRQIVVHNPSMAIRISSTASRPVRPPVNC